MSTAMIAVHLVLMIDNKNIIMSDNIILSTMHAMMAIYLIYYGVEGTTTDLDF
jgi:hypothetical protein